MGARDVYDYSGISFSLENPFQEILYELLWDMLYHYFYEMQIVEEITQDLAFRFGTYGLTILGYPVVFSEDLEFWFPTLLNQNIPEDDYVRLKEILEPILEEEEWLKDGIKRLIKQTLGDITNSEIVQRVKNEELTNQLAHFFMGDYEEVSINAINLQKIRSYKNE